MQLVKDVNDYISRSHLVSRADKYWLTQPSEQPLQAAVAK